MIVGEEAENGSGSAERGVNVGLIIKFILCCLERILNLFITFLLITTQPSVTVLQSRTCAGRTSTTFVGNIRQEATLRRLLVTAPLFTPINQPGIDKGKVLRSSTTYKLCQRIRDHLLAELRNLVTILSMAVHHTHDPEPRHLAD